MLFFSHCFVVYFCYHSSVNKDEYRPNKKWGTPSFLFFYPLSFPSFPPFFLSPTSLFPSLSPLVQLGDLRVVRGRVSASNAFYIHLYLPNWGTISSSKITTAGNSFGNCR